MADTTQAKIFKKVEVVEGGGHHGGGWKVAYADFMTAMMAFFLLMWILSSSDEQKLRGIAEYFTYATLPGGSGVLDGATLGPPGRLTASNGAVVARGSQLGKVDDPSPAQWEVKDTTPTVDPKEVVLGTRVGDQQNPAGGSPSAEVSNARADAGDTEGDKANEADTSGGGQSDGPKAEELAQFADLQAEILQAMDAHPDLSPLKPNVIFEQTPEGLRIQIVDQKGKPMFASGKANLLSASKLLMATLGESISKLPNDIVLSGHTDSVPFADSSKYDNWDLSSDRANAIRRTFVQSGVSRGRIIRVSGMADTQPLILEDTRHPSNRRISILVQHQAAMDRRAANEKAIMEKETMMADAANGSMEKSDAMGTKMADKAMEPKMAKPAMQKPAETETKLTSIDDEVFEKLRNALR